MSKVLVIDDETGVRTMISRILTNAGHEVFLAPDGARGMELFQLHRPAIVITDILMPTKEGLETIGELRRDAPDVRIIAISGGGERSGLMFLDFARDLGADAILAKPFRAAELIDLVGRASDEKT